MKKSKKMFAMLLSLLMIFANLPAAVFADGEVSASNEYFESFEKYNADADIFSADSDWGTVANGSATVVDYCGNKVLLVKPTGTAAGGAYLDVAAKLGSAVTDGNFTVDFDFKFNDKNVVTSVDGANKTPENLFSLSGGASLKEAYAFFQAPSTLGAVKAYNSNVAYTGTSGLGDAYNTAVGPETTSGNSIYMHRWNHARMVCRSVVYTDGSTEKKADYAQIYINGKLVATLPQRYSKTELTKLAVGVDPKTVPDTGIYIDNVKATLGEKGVKADTSCDYERYAFGPYGFDSDVTTTSPSDSTTLFGNTAIANERFTLAKGKTVNILDGNYGKKSTDKYMSKPASSGDYQTATSIDTLNEGEAFEISFDYLPKATNLYFTQRITGAAQPALLTINSKSANLIGDGDLYYFNTSNTGLNTDEWYRITYVVVGGNGTGTYNTASLYVNGIPIAENVELTNYAALLKSKDSTTYPESTSEYIQWQKSGRTDVQGEGNIDNLQIKVYRNGARFTAPAITEAASAGYGMQYVSDMTVGNAKSYFKLDDQSIAAYAITDESGNNVSDDSAAAVGKYLNTVTKDGRYSYAKFIANETPLKDFSSAEGFFSGTNLTVTSKEGFDYGKGADNAAIGLNSTDGVNIGKFSVTPAGGKAQTIEFYAFAPDSSFILKIAGRPSYDGTTWNGGWTLLEMSGNKIKVAKNAGTDRLTSPAHVEVGTYKVGEWIKVGMTVYSGSDKYTVRVNGKEFEGSFAKKINENGYFECQIGRAASVIIDDYKVYNGRLPYNAGTKADIDTSSLAKGMLLENNVISVGKTITDSFSATPITSNKVFVDADGKRVSAPINNGRVIFENDGIFTSYLISARTNALTQVTSDVEGKLKFVIDKTTDKNVSVINAVYCGDSLEEIKTIETVNFGSDNSVYFYVDKPTDAQKVYKLYLWELTTTVPYSKSVEYYINQ